MTPSSEVLIESLFLVIASSIPVLIFSSAVLIESLFLVIASFIPVATSLNTFLAVSASIPSAAAASEDASPSADALSSALVLDEVESPLAAESNPSEAVVIEFLISSLSVFKVVSIFSILVV